MIFLKFALLWTSCFSFLLAFGSTQASVILWSNDFEEGSSAVWVPLSTQNQVSLVSDPTGAENQVLQVWDQGTAATGTEWGEIRPGTVTYFELEPYQVKAGVDKATLSVRLFLPEESVISAQDRISLILRYSNVPSPSGNQFVTNNRVVQFSTLARNEWHTVSFLDAPILAFAPLNTGEDATSLYITPIIAMADYATSNPAGIFAYLDDASLIATPEPSIGVLFMSSVILLCLKRRRNREHKTT